MQKSNHTEAAAPSKDETSVIIEILYIAKLTFSLRLQLEQSIKNWENWIFTLLDVTFCPCTFLINVSKEKLSSSVEFIWKAVHINPLVWWMICLYSPSPSWNHSGCWWNSATRQLPLSWTMAHRNKEPTQVFTLTWRSVKMKKRGDHSAGIKLSVATLFATWSFWEPPIGRSHRAKVQEKGGSGWIGTSQRMSAWRRKRLSRSWLTVWLPGGTFAGRPAIKHPCDNGPVWLREHKALMSFTLPTRGGRWWLMSFLLSFWLITSQSFQYSWVIFTSRAEEFYILQVLPLLRENHRNVFFQAGCLLDVVKPSFAQKCDLFVMY